MTIIATARSAGPAVSDSGPDRTAPPPVRRQVSRRSNVVKVAVGTGIAAMPFLVPAGPGNTAPADLFLAIAVLVSLLWLSGRRHAMRFPYAFPISLSILAGALASTVAFAHAYGSVGGGLVTLIQDVFVLAWAITIANLGRDPALLKSITRAWVISATCWAVLMVLGVFGHIGVLSGETARNGVRAAFTLGDPNLAANYFICCLLMLRATQFPRRRLIRWTCAAILVTAIVLTGSNGGALVLIATFILGALFRLARRRGPVPAVIAASTVALAALLIVPNVHVQPIVQKAQQSSQLLQDSIGRQAESSSSRTTIFAETLQLYLTYDTPLGIGPGGTKGAFQSHLYSYVKMAHDDYTAAIVERGWLGGLALIFLLIIIATRCRSIASRPLRSEYAAIFPRPELLGAAVAGMFISGMLYQTLHFRHLWALLGIVAAVDLWGRRDSEKQARSPAPTVHRGPEPSPEPTVYWPGDSGSEGQQHSETTLGELVDAELIPGDPVGVEPIPGDPVDAEPIPGDPVDAEPVQGELVDAAAKQPRLQLPGRRDPMKWIASRITRLVPAVLTANVLARVVALASLTLATILVAHAGGPKLLGELTLLRVLPGLVGVLVGCGLPSAAPFFLANRHRADAPRVRTTILAMTLVGSLAASACWLAMTPVLHRLFFHSWHDGVVVAAAVPVFSQLWVATGKSYLQGENDMRGANWAIAAEEAAFLPVYVGLLPFLHGTGLLMSALVGADVLVTAGITLRMASKGYLRGWGKPDTRLAWKICRYGIRGQVGGMLSLVNLRLDVAILGALVGPATLGVYAVASKYAELLRLPGLAITYVLYPRLAVRDRNDAAKDVATLLPRSFVLTALAAIPLAAAVPLLPVIYGDSFSGAVIPAYILLLGLLGEGAAGLISAYLYGVGRPGANSLALGVSVIVTIALDLLLIPRHHAVGAAEASAVAYLTSSAALLCCYFVVRKRTHVPRHRTTEVHAS